MQWEQEQDCQAAQIQLKHKYKSEIQPQHKYQQEVKCRYNTNKKKVKKCKLLKYGEQEPDGEVAEQDEQNRGWATSTTM